jgi:hypothetical protein
MGESGPQGKIPINAKRVRLLTCYGHPSSNRTNMVWPANRPFLDREAALALLLGNTEVGILLNEHVAEDGLTVFAHACRLGAEGIVSRRSTAPTGPVRARCGSRSAIPRA